MSYLTTTSAMVPTWHQHIQCNKAVNFVSSSEPEFKVVRDASFWHSRYSTVLR